MLKKLQSEHKEWVKANFDDPKPWMFIMGVMEELGELSHAHLKSELQIRTDTDHKEKAFDAVGDIVIFLSGYCSSVGIDFEEAVQLTWDKVKKRDWKKNPVTG